VQLRRVKDFFDRVIPAHSGAVFVIRTQPVFGNKFARKNKVAKLILAFNIESFICREQKLHNLKFFFGISINAIHIVAALAAFFAFPFYFVDNFFGYKF